MTMRTGDPDPEPSREDVELTRTAAPGATPRRHLTPEGPTPPDSRL